MSLIVQPLRYHGPGFEATDEQSDHSFTVWLPWHGSPRELWRPGCYATTAPRLRYLASWATSTEAMGVEADDSCATAMRSAFDSHPDRRLRRQAAEVLGAAVVEYAKSLLP